MLRKKSIKSGGSRGVSSAPSSFAECYVRSRKELFAVFAAFICVFVAMAGVILMSDLDSDAVRGEYTGQSDGGSASDPYMGANWDIGVDTKSDMNKTVYIASGTDVWFRYNKNWDTTSGLTERGLSISYEGSSSVVAYAQGTLKGTGDIVFHDVQYGSGKQQFTITIHVVDYAFKVTGISINGSSSGEAGKTGTYTASVTPSNADNKAVTWSISSGSTYASITSQNDSSCTVSYKAAGTFTLKATADDGSGVTATKSVTVTQAAVSVTSISITTSGSGDSMTLTASYSPSNATVDFSWEANNTKVSFNSSAGKSVTVYPQGTGSVKITLTENNTGKTATKTVYTHELEYDANGGSGAPSSDYAIGTSVNHSMTVTSSEPYRSGWEFMGWATSASGSPRYDAGDNVSVNYNGETLYAVWGDYGYLEFDTNGGRGGPSDQSALIQEDDYEYIDIPSTEPTRSGYSFLGWSESSNPTSTSDIDYQAGGRVRVDCTETIMLTAVWGEATVITFNANSGTGGPSSQTYYIIEGGSGSIQIPNSTPSKTGYNFKGWSTSSTGSATYQPGGSYSWSAGNDDTLYAIWEQITYDYDVVYSYSPGTYGPNNEQYHGETTTQISKYVSDIVPSGYSGYTFDYWQGSDGKTYAPGAPITLSPGTTTLTAVWKEANHTFDLLYRDTEGATNVPSDEHQELPQTEYTFYVTTTQPTKAGYVFLGWATSSGASTAQYHGGEAITVPADGEEILYAVWDTATITITSTAPSNSEIKVGEQFSYTVTSNKSDVTVSVGGASWLSANGNVVSGYPSEKGVFDITVTVSKNGYTSATQTFQITVYPNVEFGSVPTNGVIAYAMTV